MAKIVRVIGDGVPYLDGAEAELLEFMKNAEDRSIGSDELAAGIHDWPSMYHLSRARANLLMPFNISENHRVLDVGCGTGALTRQFAEWGSHVTGLEGSYDRSLVACERVREFENAEIVNGSLDEYASENHKEEFDVILLCGVLEYSGAIHGGADGPDIMLATVKNLLKPAGIAIIAIENQLGMKYLLGYNEDHLGIPWIGLSDYYLSDVGVRTWTRSKLNQKLIDNGFSDSRWYGSFPDYKLPTAIISDELWNFKEGKQLARQFVRDPISDQSAPPQFNADTFLFWDLILQTDSPKDFVNSHLVVAAKSDLASSKFLKDGLLWSANGSRKKKFTNRALLTYAENRFQITHESLSPMKLVDGELSFERQPKPLYVGENMEDWLVSKLRNKSITEVSEILKIWWVEASKVIDEKNRDGVKFDVLPRNFVRDSQTNSWILIDEEWQWGKKVSKTTILVRCLMFLFLQRLNSLGIPKTIEHLTFADFVLDLAQRIDGTVSVTDMLSLVEFESGISSVVTGTNSRLTKENLEEILNRQMSSVRIDSALYNQRDKLDQVSRELDQVSRELDQVNRELVEQMAKFTEIANSKIWRVTAPLRMLLNKIR